ncbi:MAG: hypothetical protein QM477_08700 [Planctomycetota bacterium]
MVPSRFCTALALGGCFLWTACATAPVPPIDFDSGYSPPLPRPAGFEEGGESYAERQEWIESMHRAAPGFDWEAQEEANVLAAMARREDALLSRAPTTGRWNEIGSNNLPGSVFVAVPSTNGNDLYVGTARGGVFRGPADGTDWVAIGDGVFGGAYHLAVIAPASGTTDIILRATSNSMWRSADQGVTWQTPSGTSGISNVRRLIKLEDSAQTILAVVWQGGWKLLRSSDRGQSFSVVRNLNGESDLFTPRDTLGALYLFDQDRMYKSTDNGTTFANLGNSIGFNVTDIRLGGHESSGNNTFSLAVKQGGSWELWRTTDAGNSWAFAHTMNEMWSAFCTSSTDSSLVVYGGVEMWVSRDAGTTFTLQNAWWEHPGNRHHKLHADIMGVSVIADSSLSSGERWYINTHGGLSESVDQLGTTDWLTWAGMGVSQYYSTHTSRRNPDYLHAGSQDQGYQTSELGIPGSSGSWATFREEITGDYGHLSSGDGSHDLVYSDYPGFVLVTAHAPNPALYTVDFPVGFDAQWLPFLTADPVDNNVFYLCGKTIWRYQRVGTSGSWTYSALHPNPFGQQISAVAFSKIDPNFAVCVTTGGNLWTSQTGGTSWTSAGGGAPTAHYFYGTTIVPSSTDVDTVWVAGAGYSGPPVMVSTDGGVNWQDRSNGLPATLVYGLVEAPDGSGRMYAGSENGAWEYDPTTQQWSSILGGSGPITTYWSVEAVPSSNAIRFGTYGRGAWDYFPETPGFFPYGELRSGANTLQLRSSAQPLLGTSVTLTVSGAPPGAAGFLSVCTTSDDSPLLGGDILVDTATQIYRATLVADGSGVATTPLLIPNNPALIGVERYLQAAMRDASQPNGWAMSHGLRALVGQ